MRRLLPLSSLANSVATWSTFFPGPAGFSSHFWMAFDPTRRSSPRSGSVGPDAPVSRFVLELKGGKHHSLLENSEDLCRKPQKATARFTAQNGKVESSKPLIANQCGRKSKKHVKEGNGKKHKWRISELLGRTPCRSEEGCRFPPWSRRQLIAALPGPAICT
jgi:hypothetical protein